MVHLGHAECSCGCYSRAGNQRRELFNKIQYCYYILPSKKEAAYRKKINTIRLVIYFICGG